jgi:hypothetical protein
VYRGAQHGRWRSKLCCSCFLLAPQRTCLKSHGLDGGGSLADRSISGPSFRSRHTDALLLVLVLVLSLRFLLLPQVPSTGLSLAAAYRRGAVQPATHATVSAAVTFIRFSARLRFKADRNTLL